jgi:hypothetical protein
MRGVPCGLLYGRLRLLPSKAPESAPFQVNLPRSSISCKPLTARRRSSLQVALRYIVITTEENMHSVLTPFRLLLALGVMAVAVHAQQPGDAITASKPTDHRIMLKYAAFDPMLGTPEVPATLGSGVDTNLWIVQFPGPATDADREVIGSVGGKIVNYMPLDGYVVRMNQASAVSCAGRREVRWVGPYQPAYRLEPELLGEHLSGQPAPPRKYNMVMADKRSDKAALKRHIEEIGGKVIDEHIGGLLFTAELTGAQLLLAARLDEVLYIERWTPTENDMNNARVVDGANAIEAAGGYTGTGVRGHVFEGVEFNHPDFNTPLTNVASGGGADAHGHCTAGCVFGNGNSAAQARGMAPDAVGFFTQYSTQVGTRNAVINTVVNTHNCMFTTASWGNTQTTAYTAISADADDIVFDHRIPWTQSMSNLGNQMARPQAWAKNVISIGGLCHYDNANDADDAWAPWVAGGLPTAASIGPAADGRMKPDLCNFYDLVWTSDLSGGSGYTAGSSNPNFGGTSGATPITAGTNALAIQMYTDGIFGNTLPAAPTVGNRFVNRPLAQTLKALQIANATLYPVAQATRAQAGWGHPNLNTMYTRRARHMIIPENAPITQGATHTYLVNVLNGETSLKVCMTYVDPQGNVAASIARINDLTLRVISPGGTSYWGNNGLSANNTSTSGGSVNTIDTVENVFLNNPSPGNWTIQVTAPVIAQDAHLATPAVDATYALVVNGGIQLTGSGCARYIPDAGTTGTLNYIPFGTVEPSTLTSTFASNNRGNVGGAVYFDINFAANTHWTGLDVNTGATAGTELIADIYVRVGTYAGHETSPSGWTAYTAAHGVSAGPDSPSRIEFNEPPFLSGPLLLGVAVVARNFDHRYTNGANTYSNASLTYTAGAATNVPFTSPVFSPRTANVGFYFRTDTSSWTNQKYQTLLRREELGSAGTINGLAFSPGSTGKHFNRELVVRMSHVPAGYTLSTTFANNMPAPVTVLSQWNQSWHVTADAWTEIGLTSPFAYNGTSDVVVEIFARGNHNTASAGFNRASGVPRVAAYGFAWDAVPATAATNDTAGQRVRVNINCAVGTEYGSSCGPLRALHYGTPNRGGVAWFDVYDALPNGALFVGLGFNVSTPFPVGLTNFGFTNCLAFHDYPVALFKIADATGFSTHSISVPNSVIYDGTRVHGQWFGLDPAQPGGLTASNYVTNLVGIDP